MSLSEFLQSFDAAGDAGEAVLEGTLASANRRWPELAEAIEYCAIPRRFDADILGVLRGRPDDHEVNEELLAGVLGHSFVRERESSGFVYHDNVRERLLARWREPERRERLEAAVARFVEHCEEVQERASDAKEDAARVHRIIRHASSARYVQLSAALEQRLLAPFLEALDALALLSASDVVDFVDRHAFGFINGRRSTAARLLVRAARHHVAELPEDPAHDNALDRLALWEGRALLPMDRGADAERVLAPIAADDQPLERLRMLALAELGQAQLRQWHLREALQTFERETQLSTSWPDPETLAFLQLRLGDTHMVLGEPRRAREAYLVAAEAARELPDSGRDVEALAAVAMADLQLGERAAARSHAIEALDLARASMRDLKLANTWLCALLSELFADESPELLDTVSAEAKALAAGFGSEEEIAERRVDRLDLLRDSGQLARAHERVEKIERQLGLIAGELESSAFPARLRCAALIAIARLHDRLAHVDDALERLSLCERLATEARLPQYVAEARQRRGRLLATVERWAEAEADFVAAEEAWRGMGHDMSTALARGERGFVARAQGRLDEAEALVGEAAEQLAHASPDLRMRFLAGQRDHEAALGRHRNAERLAVEAAEVCARRGSLRDVAQSRARLAVLAGARGGWSVAAEHSETAARAWAQLADHHAYRPTRARGDADTQNAEGVRCLLAEDPAALANAIEQFEGAIATVSEPWYRLNLSYADAATGDWQGAIDALEQAIDDSAPLRQPALFCRLGQHHLARGWALYGTDEYASAERAFADSVARLDHPEQADARRECWIGLGDAARAQDEDDRAVAAYREADAAGHPHAGPRLAALLIELEHHDEAREVLRRALESDNGDVARYALAELLELEKSQGRRAPDDLIETFVARGGPGAALELGDLLEQRGNTEAALAAYRLAPAASPEAALRLARHFRHAGDVRTAIAHFTEAARAEDPAIAGAAAQELGDVHRGEGDVEAAVDAYQRATGLVSAPGAGLALGELLLDKGDLTGAETALMHVVASGDPYLAPLARLRLGELFMRTDHPELAHDAFRRALDSANDEASAEAAVHLLASTDGDEAEAVIAAVLHAGARVAVHVGEALAERALPGTAEALLQRASDLDSDLWWPDAALLLGDLQRARGDESAATIAFERAARSDDEQVAPEAALRLLDGQPETAERVIDEVVAAGGRKAHGLATRLAQRGDLELAKRTLAQVTEAEGPAAAEALLLLGDINAEEGDHGAAREAFGRARELGDFWIAELAAERIAQLDAT